MRYVVGRLNVQNEIHFWEMFQKLIYQESFWVFLIMYNITMFYGMYFWKKGIVSYLILSYNVCNCPLVIAAKFFPTKCFFHKTIPLDGAIVVRMFQHKMTFNTSGKCRGEFIWRIAMKIRKHQHKSVLSFTHNFCFCRFVLLFNVSYTANQHIISELELFAVFSR